MQKSLNILLMLFVALTFYGCKDSTLKEHIFGKKRAPDYINPTETYHVYVNSIDDGENHNEQKYILVPGLKGISEDNLQFKEYANYIHRAMKKAGYVKAQSKDEADIGILFAYGIGDPEKETSYRTSSYATAIPSYYNYSAISTSTTKAHTTVSYTRNIILDAYDYAYLKETEKEKQVWITKAVSAGARADLREVLPVMVAAIVPYIGKNTGRQIKLIVGAPSKELYEILGKPLPSKNK